MMNSECDRFSWLRWSSVFLGSHLNLVYLDLLSLPHRANEPFGWERAISLPWQAIHSHTGQLYTLHLSIQGNKVC